MAGTTKPPRTVERAAEVLDRAAKMKQNRVGILDRRWGDPQMRTPGYVDPPFHNNRLGPGDIKRAGTMDVPLDKIRSGQQTVSLASVKAKLTSPTTKTGDLPQLIRHDGIYYVNNGNHRITAARALRTGTIRADVADIKNPGTAVRVGGAGSTMAGGAGVAASAVAIGANAVHAYNEIKRSGGGTGDAIAEGAKAGGIAAAAPVAFGAGIAAAAKASGLPGKVALQVAGKAALPLTMLGTAIYRGHKAAKEGASPLGVAGAAAWGAVNGAVPVDFAVDAYKGLRDVNQKASPSPASRPGGLSSTDAKRFEEANAGFGEKASRAAAKSRERAGEMVEVTNMHGTTFMRRNPYYGQTKD